MTHWMCTNCGYYLQADISPNKCPGCDQACSFNNVTCYRPECGGERNIDPLLVGATLKPLTKGVAFQVKSKSLPHPKESILVTEIFSGLSAKQIKDLRSIGEVEYYEKDDIICREGDKSVKLCIVEDGQFAVSSRLGNGISVPLTIVSPNAAFSWSVLVPPYILTATVTAVTKTKILAIKRAPLVALMQLDPVLGLTIMENIASIVASRLRNVEAEMLGFIR